MVGSRDSETSLIKCTVKKNSHTTSSNLECMLDIINITKLSWIWQIFSNNLISDGLGSKFCEGLRLDPSSGLTFWEVKSRGPQRLGLNIFEEPGLGLGLSLTFKARAQNFRARPITTYIIFQQFEHTRGEICRQSIYLQVSDRSCLILLWQYLWYQSYA